MKKYLIPLYITLITISNLTGNSIIEISSPMIYDVNKDYQNKPIQNINKFKMNHGFSIRTSLNNGFSNTEGIYSNFSSYNLSNRLNIESAIYLSQGQYKMAESNINPNIGYELGLNYKVNNNSTISFKIANYKFYQHSFRNIYNYK